MKDLTLLALLFSLSAPVACSLEVGKIADVDPSDGGVTPSGATDADSVAGGDADSGAEGDAASVAEGDADSGAEGDADSGGEGDADSGGEGGVDECGTSTETYSASGVGQSSIIVSGSSQPETSQDSDFAETSVYSPSSPAVISDVTITSSSDPEEDSGPENADVSFYGYNSAVLVKNGGKLTLSCATVNHTGIGNGVFAFNGSEIILSNVEIRTTGKYGHGVDATYGGKITISNPKIYTTDHHAAGLSTDRGGGTIVATGGSVTTEGSDSPGIYSTGEISAKGTVFTAIGGEAVVVEGENSVTLEDVTLIAKGERLSDPKAVKLFQSMSGDAGSGYDGVFSMTGGKFTWERDDGPLFQVTNSNGLVNLTNVEIVTDATVLMQGVYNDKMKDAMTMELEATNQTLKGDFVADEWYGMTITLGKDTALTGAVNESGEADFANISLKATASWTVTADSYVDCVEDADGISGTTISNLSGDFSVYYDTSKCDKLGGKTYAFSSGSGSLKPN